ncbi:MAG: hypothetical protein LBT90_00800 [Holosporaceae bacterium]|jgi:hypothetical protein|nr:hypothetical protein [Holosporaceae bacterium]
MAKAKLPSCAIMMLQVLLSGCNGYENSGVDKTAAQNNPLLKPPIVIPSTAATNEKSVLPDPLKKEKNKLVNHTTTRVGKRH